MISPYGRELAGKVGARVTTNPVQKLTPNLRNKTNYIVHYRNQQFYLEMGMKLTKIHRVMEFDQSRWLKTYIDFNTVKRQAAKNAFEKDLFKLMNNSVYVKTMRNTRRHLDVKVVTSQKRAKRYIARPTLNSFKTINNEVTVINLTKADVCLNKPIYCEMSILDISKLHMYKFHYNHIVRKHSERARLPLTDTDSLCYDIRTDDVYLDMTEDLDLFHTSDDPPEHPIHNKKNAKVIGKFNDECNSLHALEFVGLASKMYSLLLPNDKEKKTAKGVKKYISRI